MSALARIAVSCACGRRLTVRGELAGARVRCPGCGGLIEVPTAEAARPASRPPSRAPRPAEAALQAAPAARVGATCTICQTVVEEGDETVGCDTCQLPYHEGCWDEYGGCATYGCKRAPKQEKKAEDARKECPFCGESIAAKALRCPACRERFEDARPVDREEYIAGIVHEPKWRALRGRAIGFLFLSLLPCTGPLALVAGILWLQSAKSELEEVGGVYRVMIGAGASIGGVYTLLLVLFVFALGVS